jgi:hypothetical protein
MIDTVAALAHLDGEGAERAVHAVLEPLMAAVQPGAQP